MLGSAFVDRQALEAHSSRRHWCENHAVRSDTDLVLLVTMVSLKETMWEGTKVYCIRMYKQNEMHLTIGNCFERGPLFERESAAKK